MSEHQYYEFATFDRTLTVEEIAKLRALSSRARITPHSFVNDSYGDLKGCPADWMRRYFDAYVYTANWGARELALRVPREVFKSSGLKRFSTKHSMTIDVTDTHWIINWSLEDGEECTDLDEVDNSAWMGHLSPLRYELMRGDTRSLYLGWLAGVCAGEVSDKSLEPVVPPGLAQLSTAQQALVDFLVIDPDLLAAAAAGSPVDPALDDNDNIEVWVADLRRNEYEFILTLLVQGASEDAERMAKSSYYKWLKESETTLSEPFPAERRKVAALRAQAEIAEKERLERESKRKKSKKTTG